MHQHPLSSRFVSCRGRHNPHRSAIRHQLCSYIYGSCSARIMILSFRTPHQIHLFSYIYLFTPQMLRITKHRNASHALHSLSHPGICTMQLDHLSLCLTQHQCQCSQMGLFMYPVPEGLGTSAHHLPSGYFYNNIPDTLFNHIHMNHVGPLPPCKGYLYILTCTCVYRFAHWPDTITINRGCQFVFEF
jgi:hypothetical protein